MKVSLKIATAAVLTPCLLSAAQAQTECLFHPWTTQCRPAIANIETDLRDGIGPNNELLRLGEHMAETAAQMSRDITEGPGQNNDIVGRDGWLRSRLGF